jgi:hypothetical protein
MEDCSLAVSGVAFAQEHVRERIALMLALHEQLAVSCLAHAWLHTNKQLFGRGVLDLRGSIAPALPLNSVITLLDVGSKLNDLCLDGCGATEGALSLLIHCQHLKHLSLRNCKSVRSLDWIRIAKFENLLTLDVSGCDKMAGGSILTSTPYSGGHPLDRFAARPHSSPNNAGGQDTNVQTSQHASANVPVVPLMMLRSLSMRGINQTGQNAFLIHMRGFCSNIETIHAGWWSEFDKSEPSGFAQPCFRIELEHFRAIFRKQAQRLRVIDIPGAIQCNR